MPNPLAAHPPWRQLLIISLVLPLLIVLAVLAFAWPAARIAPRDLPVGVVGACPASQHAVQGLARAEPGAFDIQLYPSQPAAREAIEDRSIYGAFVITGNGRRITVLEASAASPTVAQLLTTVGGKLASAEQATGASVQVRDVDVVPTSAGDPRGLVLEFRGAADDHLRRRDGGGHRPAARVPPRLAPDPRPRRRLRRRWPGQLPDRSGLPRRAAGRARRDLAAMSLTLLAIGATTAGLIALVGSLGLGLGAATMIFIGNPFSGVTVGAQLLPTAVDHIGQWLPPGAGANLLRSTAYFHGHGAAGHLTVLVAWTVFGIGAVILGHHGPIRFAASAARKQPSQAQPSGPQMALLEPVQPGPVRVGEG